MEADFLLMFLAGAKKVLQKLVILRKKTPTQQKNPTPPKKKLTALQQGKIVNDSANFLAIEL